MVMFDEKEEEALQFSHTVMRYTILSYVLAVKRISTVNIKPVSKIMGFGLRLRNFVVSSLSLQNKTHNGRKTLLHRS